MAKFSLCVWSNDDQLTEGLCIPSLTPPWQMGGHDVQVIIVHPQGRARNMGEAYNGAASLMEYPYRIYAHQDVIMEDRYYLTKLAAMFADERVGMVGIVGSTIDTGGAFFHAPKEYKRGEEEYNRADQDIHGSFMKVVHGLEIGFTTRFKP